MIYIPQLSIVIPTFNEADRLPSLLSSLSIQKELRLEVIVVDAGSMDNTLNIAQEYLYTSGLVFQCLGCDVASRGQQMNCGASVARASDLLFLHADTQIENHFLLKNAKIYLDNIRQKLASCYVAGHFSLRFQRNHTEPSLAYYYYEAKTMLNRPYCINGDQGFWMSKKFFQNLGQFDQSLPYMEDARLSQQIFKKGRWLTLPGHVYSSARRFEAEGLSSRQTLNALLCNFDYIGFDRFFSEAIDAYQQQDKAKSLNLLPFFTSIRRINKQVGWRKSIIYWIRTGRFVASNAWQIAFFMDCYGYYKKNYVIYEDAEHVILQFYDRWLKFIVCSMPSAVVTAWLVFIWFYSLFFILKLKIK